MDIIWSNEEYLSKFDRTLQIALVDRKSYYVLNTGDGYESIFDSIMELYNYLNGKPFKRVATVEREETENFLKSI